MSIVRTIMVALTALSVAMLPVAGASARVFATDTSVAVPSDCCPQGQDCETQAKGGCAKLAGCALKCSSFSAATLTPSGIAFSPSAAPQASTLAGIATTRSSTPPSPPPRA